MYAKRFISLNYLLPSSIYSISISLVSTTLAYILYVVLGNHNFVIPLVPITIIGTAVSFYVGFKNNSSYDRLWEARRIWGNITNYSRTWGTMVMSLIINDQDEDTQETGRTMVRRQVAWCNALRLQLRRNPVWSEKYYQSYASHLSADTDIRDHFPDFMANILQEFGTEEDKVATGIKQNMANYFLNHQSRDLKNLKNRGVIDAMEHLKFTEIIEALYNQQGGAERIKSYPFPRQYAIFSRLFVDIFCFLLPFALVAEVVRITPETPWLLFPICLVVSWIFNTMEQIGDFSENPFENAVTDIPLRAICRNIEIDLREMLGETALPPKIQPDKGILM